MEYNKITYKIRNSEFELNYEPNHVLVPEYVISKISDELGILGDLKDVSTILNRDKNGFIPTIKGYDFDRNGWKLMDEIEYIKLPRITFDVQSDREKKLNFENSELNTLNQKNTFFPILRPYATNENEVLVDCRQLIIKFTPNLNESEVNSLIENLEIVIVHKYSFTKNTYKLIVPSNISATQFIYEKELNRNKNIIYAEVCYIRSCEISSSVGGTEEIEDDLYSLQWHLNTIGFESALHAVERNPKNTVKLGVIDFGFSESNPEILPINWNLSGKFHSSLAFSNGKGIKFANHGTQCAAIALGRKNKLSGVGVAYDTELIVVQIPRVLKNDVNPNIVLCEYSVFAEAIAHLVNSDSGIDVISCSILTSYLGPDYHDGDCKESIIIEALDLCEKARNGLGLPVFWAVPNEDIDISNNNGDAIYKHRNVIVVGSSDENNYRVKGGYGRDLDFLAPGKELVITKERGCAGKKCNGSSYATALSAGIACFVLTYKNNLRFDRLKEILISNCEAVKSGESTIKIGSGIINLSNIFNNENT